MLLYYIFILFISCNIVSAQTFMEFVQNNKDQVCGKYSISTYSSETAPTEYKMYFLGNENLFKQVCIYCGRTENIHHIAHADYSKSGLITEYGSTLQVLFNEPLYTVSTINKILAEQNIQLYTCGLSRQYSPENATLAQDINNYDISEKHDISKI